MSDKCLVKGCPNHKGEGRFIGDLCAPCHRMLQTGTIGSGQTFIHRMRDVMAKTAISMEQQANEMASAVPPGAAQVLCPEYLHCPESGHCLHAKWHGFGSRGHEKDRAVGCGNKLARCR